MKKYIPLQLLLLFGLVNFSAHAEILNRSYNEERTQFDLGVNYFKTTANFISDGTKTDLLSGAYLQNIDVTAEARYVLLEDFGITAGMNIGTTETSDVLAVRKNSTLNKVSIGADYQIIHSSAWNLVADVAYIHSLEKVDPLADSALNNDGVGEVKALVTTSLNWDWIVPYVQGGINYRLEGLSTLALYGGGVELRFADFTLGGALNGSITVKDDDETDAKIARLALLARVNAGSFKYYSINPSLLDSELYLRYYFNPDISVRAFAGYTVLGTNAAEGFHGGAQLTWAFGGIKKSSLYNQSDLEFPPKKTRKPLPVSEPSKGFSEDLNDGVNQDYFKPVNPGQEEYIQQIDGSPSSLRNTTEPDADEEPQVTMKPKPMPAPDKDYKIQLKKKKRRN